MHAGMAPGGIEHDELIGRLWRVLAAWDLGEPLCISEVTGGATNRVFRVQGMSRVTFLRGYRRRDPEVASREHALIRHARGAGLPAPPPIRLSRGGTVLVIEDEVYALYEAAEGDQLDRSELTVEHALASGHALGALHAALAVLQDAGYVRWALTWNGAEWIERLANVERPSMTRLACALIRRDGSRRVQSSLPCERVRSSRHLTRPSATGAVRAARGRAPSGTGEKSCRCFS